ncbi:MAG: hypothetical protein J6S63_02660, partial [Atopobiaceae bacterium]|nr:hypothetical protein [Atopobiaceae bacterium]
LYYIVEFDLTGAHFRVMVDAIDGGIIDVTESVNGEVINYADQQGDVVTEEQAVSNGMTPNFSKDQCIYNAKSSTGAGDSATNVTSSDLITGGGTLYYIVEFDLTGAHFRVMVDAIDGGIIDVTESVNGEVINYE